MMINKKGAVEPAGDVAALILLILVFIILYILLLPPAERDELLQDNNVDNASGSYGGNYGEETLLSAAPGELHPLIKGTISKEISPVALFVRTEDKVINIATALTVEGTPFSQETKQLSFKLDDIKNLNDAKLFFFIKEADGEAFVELNGNVIYDGELTSNNVPISLPVNNLGANNVLRIGMKSRWWDAYILKDVYIKASYNFENTRVKRTFEVSNREKSNMEKARMRYFLNCMGREQGLLSIILNDKLLESDYAVCDAGERILELNTRDVDSGTNIIEFRTDKGSYNIEGLELDIESKEGIFPVYNFEVTNEIYKKIYPAAYVGCERDCGIDCRGDNTCYNACIDNCEIETGRKNIILVLTFADEGRKKAAITVNEFQVNVNTQAPEYTRVISDYIGRGDNAIKIIPKSDFEIDNLRVVVD